MMMMDADKAGPLVRNPKHKSQIGTCGTPYKKSDSYFVDMMYVEFMKNFLLTDSSERIAVRFILASWAQKQVILTL